VLALRGTAEAGAMTAFYIPAGAMLLVLALTTLLAQNMATTLLRKRVVERAVVARTAELSTANSSLVLEVEQRRQAEADLRVARDRAESASRAKSAFLATMSHELRTPLNAIIGFSDIMAQAPAPVPQQADYAGEILSNGRRLLDLINDILDLTQMETPETALDQDLFYLSDCLPVLIEKAEPAARVAGVTLRTRIPDGLPPLHGDAKRIAKAIAHLVGNAIKFTPQGGAAVVAVHHSAATLVVEVMDTGVGISAAARERIREDFWQQEGHLSRRHEGTGLGLAYVARVADLHGAGFSILSEPGKGTCVRLIFTCAEPQHVREVA
jgi:signal transduction histidine kinase